MTPLFGLNIWKDTSLLTETDTNKLWLEHIWKEKAGGQLWRCLPNVQVEMSVRQLAIKFGVEGKSLC